MMCFDDFFTQRKYDINTYNCLHFVVEAQRELFGRDLSFLLDGLNRREDGMFNLGGMAKFKGFRRLPSPRDECLVLLRGAGADDTHVGTFLDGKVLHISRAGVQFLPLEVVKLGFTEVLFYEYALA